MKLAKQKLKWLRSQRMLENLHNIKAGPFILTVKQFFPAVMKTNVQKNFSKMQCHISKQKKQRDDQVAAITTSREHREVKEIISLQELFLSRKNGKSVNHRVNVIFVREKMKN